MRLFIAIDLPDELKEELAGLSSGIPGARWVPADNMHITLRFIGEAGGGTQDDVVEALSQVRGQPFELALKGVGHFESRRQPHAVWAGVVKTEPLVRLRESVEAAVQRAGLDAERRKYVPHVTLARLKHADPVRLQSFMTEHSLYQSPPFPVSGFTLFSSFLSRSGAIYRPEAEFPFERHEEPDDPEDDWSSYDPWNAAAER